MTISSLANEFVNADLEASLLAAIYKNPKTYSQVVDKVPDGTVVQHAATWETLQGAVVAGKKPVPPKGFVGTPAADPVAVAEALLDLRIKREIAAYQEELGRDLFGDTSGVDVVNGMEHAVSRLRESVRELAPVEVRTGESLVGELLEDLRERQRLAQEEGTAVRGVQTSIKPLDAMLGGLQDGIHILAGEPGVGKTSFMMMVAGWASQSGIPVLIVSFEEAVIKLVLKFLCTYTGTLLRPLLDGDGDLDAFAGAIKEHHAALRLLSFIEGSGKLSVSTLRARAETAMAQAGTGRCLVMVDYIQRWAAGQNNFDEYRHVVANLVSQLRDMSKALKSPVVAISSQNRPGQGRAALTSLKESGDIEYSADTAMFLVVSKERKPDEGVRAVDLFVEKNRFGDTGKIELLFRPATGLISTAEDVL